MLNNLPLRKAVLEKALQVYGLLASKAIPLTNLLQT
jgi:hypothetical protein